MNLPFVLTPQTTMQEILQAVPHARDLLFERYHVGGCASCSYQPEETLAQVCQRFNVPDVAQAIHTLLHDKPTPPRFAGPKIPLAAPPVNAGPMENADAVGMVGNAECGEMMTIWLKFKESGGRKVIDKATFESFGCETAIGMAARATELLRGRTAEEALSLPPSDLVGAEGPLPPIKIHCAQLVEGALKAALEPAGQTLPNPATAAA